jgi:hypothetical protein
LIAISDASSITPTSSGAGFPHFLQDRCNFGIIHGILCHRYTTHHPTPDITMIHFLLWLILFILAWPVAILALLLYPVIWLLVLPFRLVGIVFEGLFELFRGLMLLPARILGQRRPTC